MPVPGRQQTQEEQPEVHVCGQCEAKFDTAEQYLDHTCNRTGFQPTDPRHLGEDFAKVSEAALARGNRTAELVEGGMDFHEAQAQAAEENK